MSPLGPMGPGSPRAPTRSGGEISLALALLLPQPRPCSQYLPSRGSRGALMFSLVPGSPRVGGGGRGLCHPESLPPDPPQVQGQGLLRLLGLLGLQYSGTPGDHPLRPTGELGRPRPTRRSRWGQQGGDWHLTSQTHSHKGVCFTLTHSPWRPPSPGLPWAAGEPQSGAGSSGAAGVGGTACSMTVSTATCGGRGRGMGWVPGSHQGQASQRATVLGAGGPSGQ